MRECVCVYVRGSLVFTGSIVPTSTMLVMPAYSEGDGGLGAKMVTMYPGNAEKGLPTHNGLILLFNHETGIPQAVSGCDLYNQMTSFV